MIGFSSYDSWKLATPPEWEREDEGELAREEYERDLAQHEQELFEQGAIECDERAPWPGDPERPFEMDADTSRDAAGIRNG